MLQYRNINLKKLIPLGIVASIGASLISFSPVKAASPTVTATFMDPVGNTSLQPGTQSGSASSFYVPVRIDTQDVGSLSVSVKAATSSLTGIHNSTNTIASVPDGQEYTIGQMSNQWGYRWNLGDSISDAPTDGSNPKNYKQMPTTSTLLSTTRITGSQDKTITKYLTLGFGVGVTADTPTDTYTNEITVSVVASPLKMTIFDITYMQDMTADICYNTTTPTTKTISTGVDINAGPDGKPGLVDTTGDHQGDGAYVPQKELIDRRDGKKYTIRKLADGNCWMVSNLEFDFMPTAHKDIVTGTAPSYYYSADGTHTMTGSQIVLTNEDTDLNSITTWTPEISSKLYGTTGTAYITQRNAGKGTGTNEDASSTHAITPWNKNGVAGLRSFSSAAGYPNAQYSTKTAATPTFGTANTGRPWQKFGNLYNWTAATLGSGTKAINGQDAEDSICPKGWKLPSTTGNDAFSNLIGAYGFSTDSNGDAIKANQIANFPINFLRTGYYNEDGLVYYRNRYASLWYATSGDSIHAFYLNAHDTTVYPKYSYYRGIGFAIRCVAR